MPSTNIRYPAEWEKQDAILLAWPKKTAGWAHLYEPVQDDYALLVATILRYEPVILCIHPDDNRSEIENRIASKRIPLFPLSIVEVDSDDSWARDFGPLSIEKNGEPRLIDLQFNGWGNKYPADKDNQVSPILGEQGLLTPLTKLLQILEGGSLDSNGAGLMLTTSRCLLHEERNPSLKRSDYEALFREQFGVKKVLWLDHGWLAGDDTDGHIDMLARFTNENTIAYIHCDDSEDEHYAELESFRQELNKLSDLNGQPFNLEALPFPTPCFSEHGERLPASYANFLVLNNAVLCPVYDVIEDDEAIMTLQKLFPGRTIEAIPARHFIHQGGSVHCLTMQLMKGATTQI